MRLDLILCLLLVCPVLCSVMSCSCPCSSDAVLTSADDDDGDVYLLTVVCKIIINISKKIFFKISLN